MASLPSSTLCLLQSSLVHRLSPQAMKDRLEQNLADEKATKAQKTEARKRLRDLLSPLMREGDLYKSEDEQPTPLYREGDLYKSEDEVEPSPLYREGGLYHSDDEKEPPFAQRLQSAMQRLGALLKKGLSPELIRAKKDLALVYAKKDDRAAQEELLKAALVRLEEAEKSSGK